ncbi:FecR family protein [Carboxylicivirga mesophila]|uniref:FecR family protein n=1 Tax=Carboxylicivirga mesophila TaxID=1166478 RepID=A0ABS5K6S3_9BACT|nr:FecR family protein [Carboxylicivirga mesophila]MBS2210688.1 FecR family protein [Carboxylicivirga mesophila]
MEMSEDILIQYIKGELPADEMDHVSYQLRQNEELFHQYIQLKDIWDYTGLTTDVHKYDVKREWKRLPIRSAGRTSFMKLAGVAGVAAAMVIAFFVGQLVETDSDSNSLVSGAHVFTAPEGQISELTLSDGSNVVLNAGSSLTIPSNFGKQNRDVQLSGEAHFNVTKNPDLIFKVKSGQQYVSVLGTIFNIRAYPGETKIITTLEEGIVRWESNGRHITLKPDMQVVYDLENQDVEQISVDAGRIGQWSVGRYVFENAPFIDIIDVIEKWYDVEIDWQQTDFEGEHYNGVIKKSASLNETLELIAAMTPVRYEVKGQQISIRRMR